MRALLLAILGLLLAAAVNANAESVVIIDDWWNVDYAKEACEHAKTFMADNRQARETFTACSEYGGPTQALRIFEDRLTSELLANPQCAGVSIGQVGGPDTPVSRTLSDAAKKPNWSLSINFVPGSDKQSWQLLYGVAGTRPRNAQNASSSYADGEDTAKDLAKKLCAIVTGQGAKMLQ